jgi:cytochrome c biogenesis protein CcdA
MIITILSPIVLCAASIWLGYVLGQRKSQREYARQLSELARESVQRDIALAKLQKVIEAAKI